MIRKVTHMIKTCRTCNFFEWEVNWERGYCYKHESCTNHNNSCDDWKAVRIKTEYDAENPRFRDEFGCVNDLLTGKSYTCGSDCEKDSLDYAIELCELLNQLYNETLELKNLKNLCKDYNLKLEWVYDIVVDSIENKNEWSKKNE